MNFLKCNNKLKTGKEPEFNNELKTATAQIYSRETIEGNYFINLIRVRLLGLEKKLILRVKYSLRVDGQVYSQVKRIPLEDEYDHLIVPVLDSDYIEVVYEIREEGRCGDKGGDKYMYSEIVGRVDI